MKQRFSFKKNNPRYHFEFPIDIINLEGDTLLIDKPYACTSYEIIAQLKKTIRKITDKPVKVGHAGTLDPLATGLLVVCIGKNTRQLQEIQQQEKEYVGTFTFGATTPSYDLEQQFDNYYPYEHITEKLAEEVATSFIGEIEQVPPFFSAVKIKGQRAYELARENISIELMPKKVLVREFQIIRYELPEIDFRIVCSKGTYIRSIARDYGEKLQSGAHLSKLRRTRIGAYLLEDVLSIQYEAIMNEKR